MTLSEIAQTVTALIAVGTTIGAIVFGLYHGVARTARTVANDIMSPIGVRLAVVEVKVDTVWSALMRRAEASAVNSGMATMNSPLTFGDEQISWMDGLASDLQASFRADWAHLDDDDLCLALERKFGSRIQIEVCIPHGLADLSCLLLACAVARG